MIWQLLFRIFAGTCISEEQLVWCWGWLDRSSRRQHLTTRETYCTLCSCLLTCRPLYCLWNSIAFDALLLIKSRKLWLFCITFVLTPVQDTYKTGTHSVLHRGQKLHMVPFTYIFLQMDTLSSSLLVCSKIPIPSYNSWVLYLHTCRFSLPQTVRV